MTRLKRATWRLQSLLLCALLLTVGGVLGLTCLKTANAATNLGANPKPVVDIAVHVPEDYPGTFLDFRDEMTAKLVAEGMDPKTFRITDTSAKIDTTNLNGWYVYDHYYSDSDYTRLVPVSERSRQPKRLAADRAQNNTYVNMTSYYGGPGLQPRPGSVMNFDRHVYSFQNNGKSNMAFVGYATPGLMDYMFYPATNDTRRNIEFDLEAAAIDLHTVFGGGFLLNAGIQNNKLVGYILYIIPNSAKTEAAVSVRMVNLDKDFSASRNGDVDPIQQQSAVASGNISLGGKGKIRVYVSLKKDSVTIQTEEYDASDNIIQGSKKTFNNGAIALTPTGLNGFGPLVSYRTHGCSSISSFLFTDLLMSYAATPFDALKCVQYYEGAEYKYFVNLVGKSGNPEIPSEADESYTDGINRMNQNEIFYLSNAQDGSIVTDTTKDADGNIVVDKDGKPVHTGLGATNGLIAQNGDYVAQMAKFIAKNYREGNHFTSQDVFSDLPLANFYVKNVATDEQLMTIHLQHLVNNQLLNQADGGNRATTVSINIHDKSKPGQLAGADGHIAQWKLRVIDPGDNVVLDSPYVDDPSKLPNYTFTTTGEHGRYTLELVVKDQKGNESKASQTYVTAFKDTKFPNIVGENTSRNIATITLTDTGEGIDDDGITFIEDDRGSGVAAYYITDKVEGPQPADEDWNYLDAVTHSTSIQVPVTSTDPIVVWTMDECGNIGAKAVFQPKHVIVKDPDGDEIDDYYVIGEKPVIVLPDEDDERIPDKTDDGDFSGWEIEDPDPTKPDTPITPGTTPNTPENTIIVKPSYSQDYAYVQLLANGGTFAQGDKTEYTLVSGNSILAKMDKFTATPTREGYVFKGWKIMKSSGVGTTDATNAANASYISNANNVATVTDQRAVKVYNTEGDKASGVKLDRYYLVAQWEIGHYNVILDANGGNLGDTKKLENIAFGTDLGTLKDADSKSLFPVSGRFRPDRPGYFFYGWSVKKTNPTDSANTSNIFVKSTEAGNTGTVAFPKMPASDLTVYAVWVKDPSQFRVSFDTNGAGTIDDSNYPTSTATTYGAAVSRTGLPSVSRSGYDFVGWFHVDADGNPVGDAVTDNTKFTADTKVDHTLKAQWTPSDDTGYSIYYFYNSGTPDKDGNYIYSNSAAAGAKYTQTLRGTTESHVTMDPQYELPEITINGKDYWLRPATANNPANVYEGDIAGDGSMGMYLYYDRYFEVEGSTPSVNEGSGSVDVSEADHIKEGQTGTVTWKADEGSYVSRVFVDGVARDDLAFENSYSFDDLEGGFHDNHKVEVEFSKGIAPEKPNPNKDYYYRVDATVLGCTDPSKYEISPSQTLIKGSDAKVEWKINDPQYVIESITIDGKEQSSLEMTSVDFKSIGADHSVVVKVVNKEPSLGGTSQPERYTVTVNRYGGNDQVEVSSSRTVNKGETVKDIAWKTNGAKDADGNDYVVYKVLVDGKATRPEIKGGELTNGSLKSSDTGCGELFSGLKANHVVDIYIGTKPEGTSKPIGDFDTDSVKVTTKLVGASGTITGGAVLDKGSNYTVGWQVEGKDAVEVEQDGKRFLYSKQDPNASGVDRSSDDYFCYEIESVTVTDSKGTHEQEKNADDAYVIKNIEEDTHVEVKVKPVKHKVTVIKHGQGKVGTSQVLWHLQDYKAFNAEPAAGWSTALIRVDGKVTHQITVPETQATEPEAQAVTPEVDTQATEPEAQAATPEADAVTPEVQAVEPEAEATEDVSALEAEDEGTAVEAAVADEPVVSETDEASEPALSGAVFLRRDANFMNALFKAGNANLITVDETVAEDKSNASGVVENVGEELDEVIVNHVIEVYFTENDSDGNPTPMDPKDIESLCNVTVEVKAPAGAKVEYYGDAKVKEGDNTVVPVGWTVPDGYKLQSVTLDEVNLGIPEGQDTYRVTNIHGDRHLVITIVEKNDPGNYEDDPDVPKIDPNPEGKTFTVKTIIKGANGAIITGSGTVDAGASREVSWSGFNPDEYDVTYVFVSDTTMDAQDILYLRNNKDAIAAGKVTLEDIQADTTVVVQLTKKGESPENVDKDGDDDPELIIPDPANPDDKKPKDDDRDGLPDGLEEDTRKHGVDIEGDEGVATTATGVTVTHRDNADMWWTLKDGYELVSVTVTDADGNVKTVQPTSEGHYLVKNVTGYTKVSVTTKAKGTTPKPPQSEPPAKAEKHTLTVTIDNGGWCTPAKTYDEGAQGTAQWSPASGYKVTKVTVNGQERADLVKSGTTTFTTAMDADYNVVVTTVAKSSTTPPPSTPNRYSVAVTIDRGTTTGSRTYNEGDTATLTWTPAEHFKVDKVYVDGVEFPSLKDAGTYAFENLNGAHTIRVTTAVDPDNPPQTPPTPPTPPATEKFTITATVDHGSITGNGSVDKGSDHTVTWSAADGYKVDKVLVDDKEMPELKDATSYTFKNVEGNHTLTVITVADSGSKPVDPVETVFIDTFIDHGTITGAGSVKKGSTVTVAWNVAPGYKVDKVVVDNLERPDLKDATSTTFTGVTEGHKVIVTTVVDSENPPAQDPTDPVGPNDPVAPKLTVVTDDGAQATIENVKTFSGTWQETCAVDGSHSHKVSWQVKDGYELVSVTVDGAPHGQSRTITDSGSDSVTFAMDQNHTVRVTTRRVTPPPAEKNLVSVVFEGNGANAGWSEGTGYFGSDEAVDVKWGAREGYKVVEVRLNDGPADEALLAAGEWKTDGLDGNTVIHVVIEKDGASDPTDPVHPDDPKDPSDDPDDPGNDDPDDPGNDDPKDPGNDDPKDPGNDDPKDPTDDPKDPGSDDPKDPGNDPSDPSNPDSLYHQVTITINNGSVTGTQLVHHGDSHTVTWKPADGTEVRYVFVNGVPRQDLIKDGGLVFSAVNQPEHVVVVTAKPGEVPTNIDTDGDGEPDLNIDTDNDGKPDINVDTDGDGKPDLNVDSDGDGKPDVNIDTNGDGIPDQNIDQVWRDRISATNRLPWTGGSAGSFGSYGSAIIGRLLPKTGDPAASVAAISTLLASSGAIAASAVLIRSRRRDDDEF